MSFICTNARERIELQFGIPLSSLSEEKSGSERRHIHGHFLLGGRAKLKLFVIALARG